MTDKISLVRRIAGIVLAAAAVICALACIIACLHVYRSGDRPFTPERIAEAWRTVAIFFYPTVALTIGTGVLYLLYPAPAQKPKGTVFPSLRLAKIKARLARKQYSDEQLLPLVKQEKMVRVLRISAVTVCILCAVYPLIYLNNPDHYTSIDQHLNTQVIAAVVPSLISAVISLAYCLTVRIISDASCEKAILYAKSLMLLPAPPAEKKPEGKQERGLPSYTTFVLRVIFLVAAAGMILAGIFNGSANDVLQKAIRICTECIGLG